MFYHNLYKMFLVIFFVFLLLNFGKCLAAPLGVGFQCNLLEDATWNCKCSHANQIFALHQSRDFFIVCNNNFEMSLMKSAGMFLAPEMRSSERNENPSSVNEKSSNLKTNLENETREKEHNTAIKLLMSQKKEADEKTQHKIDELTKKIEILEKQNSKPESDKKHLSEDTEGLDSIKWQKKLLEILAEKDNKVGEKEVRELSGMVNGKTSNRTTTIETTPPTSTTTEKNTTTETVPTSTKTTTITTKQQATAENTLKFDGCTWNGEQLKKGESRKEGFCTYTCIGKMNMYRIC